MSPSRRPIARRRAGETLPAAADGKRQSGSAAVAATLRSRAGRSIARRARRRTAEAPDPAPRPRPPASSPLALRDPDPTLRRQAEEATSQIQPAARPLPSSNALANNPAKLRREAPGAAALVLFETHRRARPGGLRTRAHPASLIAERGAG